MKQIRSVTIFFILVSFVFADHGRAKHKKWKNKKRHKVKVVDKQPRLKISLGYNYFWRNWNFGYHHWNKYPSKDIVVINKEVIKNIETEDFDEIISKSFQRWKRIFFVSLTLKSFCQSLTIAINCEFSL